SGDSFSELNQYNTEGFNYYNSYSCFDSATYETETYKYTPGDPYGVEVYFTQPYSKVNAVEDRAEVFEVATNPKNPDYGYITNENIQAKVKYISQELRKYFDTTGWPEVTFWETTLQ
ncbi:MAG: hypothetical protein IJX12_00460, partial [Lachnospiraceae bacterium]|nr:hypothetical protein [Lachnospiraceae bacterium]